MGTIQENLPENDGNVELPVTPPMAAVSARQALPAKGSCWYCEKPLDSVRRFCGKECADSFDEEAEYTR